MSGKLMLYASAGPELAWYEADIAAATLERRGSVKLPANVQYAWPHVSRRYLYATSSDSASGVGGLVGKTHRASALRIDPASGALTPHGEPAPLPSRPIHNATDRHSKYLLTAHNNPSAVTVHGINPDGTIGAEIKQPGPLDAGIFAHQVLLTPDDRLAIIVTRGHDADQGKPEEPGALKIYRFRNGVLSDGVTVAPNGGYGFGPRHLDFHPTQPWMYVSLERQNKLAMFRLGSETPLYTKDLLAEPRNLRPRQLGGAVHVHPNGRYVYGINRSDGGGENSLAVFSIDTWTGEPELIQHADTQGIHPRTFHIDPSGRLLVAAHIRPAKLSVFRVARDGKLSYVRGYDVDAGNAFLWWMGMVQL